MAENPVIKKFGSISAVKQGPSPSAGDLQNMYDAPAYAGPRGSQRYMTLDDVVQRTAAMLGLLLVTATITWILTPATGASSAVVIVPLIVGFGLAMYMSFTLKANAVLCLLYAGLEGVVLGAISRVLDTYYPGIVVQAVTGTVMVAGGMLFVYKIGAIRVTPKFQRVLIGGFIGIFGLIIVNAISYLFTPHGLGINEAHGTVAVLFSLLCIGLAAMSLVADFDMIEQGIRRGADQKFAWYAAFGLTVTLVWLYLEILRLLSALNGRR
jgi:uncharacterized YccA/Bax inhibitor family protein